jgi:hypothetical protein
MEYKRFNQITIETATKGKLTILNLSDRQILQQEFTAPATTIDVSTLPGWIYVVKMVCFLPLIL